MKLIIFAGGTGTRFWPFSRKNYPKQFKKIFNGESTLQLAVSRLEKTFGTDNIYISTNENYVSIVKEQLPQISLANVFAEPEKRNVGPAVGYCLTRLKKVGYKGPVAILWADHLIENVAEFIHALKKGKDLIYENPKRLVFISEEPRYAENNLGWIHIGKKIQKGVYEFKEWHYKPPLEKCKEMFDSGEWKWNPGYFIVDLEFTLSLYEKHVPEIFKGLQKIEKALGTVEENKAIKRIYPKFEAIHFDRAIAERIPNNMAVVVTVNMGWADPGTLYALKEAKVKSKEENLQEGLVVLHETKDSVVINEDKHKLVAAVKLNGMVVVNTQDALIVVHKDNVLETTDLLKKLEKNKKFAKFV
ncbi:MAG: mannose-1-phosphate guanylyltransferase [Patescibacteria group bacterium]